MESICLNGLLVFVRVFGRWLVAWLVGTHYFRQFIALKRSKFGSQSFVLIALVSARAPVYDCFLLMISPTSWLGNLIIGVEIVDGYASDV